MHNHSHQIDVYYLFISNYHLQKQIDEVNLSNEELQLKIDSTDKEPYNELTVLQGTYSSLEAIDNYVSGLSKIDKQNILQLQKKLLSGMTLNSISYNQDSKERLQEKQVLNHLLKMLLSIIYQSFHLIIENYIYQ